MIEGGRRRAAGGKKPRTSSEGKKTAKRKRPRTSSVLTKAAGGPRPPTPSAQIKTAGGKRFRTSSRSNGSRWIRSTVVASIARMQRGWSLKGKMRSGRYFVRRMRGGSGKGKRRMQSRWKMGDESRKRKRGRWRRTDV